MYSELPSSDADTVSATEQFDLQMISAGDQHVLDGRPAAIATSKISLSLPLFILAVPASAAGSKDDLRTDIRN